MHLQEEEEGIREVAVARRRLEGRLIVKACACLYFSWFFFSSPFMVVTALFSLSLSLSLLRSRNFG